jgi:parallel beta-helix repeat protein
MTTRIRRGHGLRLAAALLAVAGFSTSTAEGAASTLYVDRASPACSDSGPGSQSQPFCTIGAGAAVVAAGQTVQVASGTYPEAVRVTRAGAAGAPIVFTSAPGADVTLTGATDGFALSGASWVTVNGFTITGTVSYGINVSGGSHVTISNTHVSQSGHPVQGQIAAGIRLSGVSDSLVSRNVSDHNSDYGIAVVGGSTGVVVSHNQTFNNSRVYERATAGIRIYQSVGNTVDGNITHDNQDSGIECYPGANSTLVINNVSYNNGDHGIDNLTAIGERIIGNTVFHNVTAGINVEGGSTGATVANNISVDNGIKSPRTHSDIRIEHGSTAGTTVDYDLVHLSTPDTLLIWDSVSYSTLAAFQQASGQETHGVVADPQWRSPGGGDFHLTAGSSAIDSANSGASGAPSVDVEGNGRRDDPGTPDTGAGPRSYDDRGAYEFGGSTQDQPPAATLAVTPSAGRAPLQVTADASGSADTDATPIQSYSFDFGDGSAPTGPQAAPTANHTFADPGTFTVTVTVTDTAGLASTVTATVSVAAPADNPPVAALAVTPSSGPAPLQVAADASGSSDPDATPIQSYGFDFGDGSVPTGPQPGATAAHTYTADGTYTVAVTVTDTAGQSSTAHADVTVGSSQNLVANPGFEAGLTGWNTSGSGTGVTIARVSDAHSGSFAGELANTSTSPASCTLNDSPNWVRTTVSGTYTGSFWVKAPTAGATLKVRFREYDGTTNAGSVTAQFTLTTSWQHVFVNYAPSVLGSTLDFNAYISSAPPGTCFTADDVDISVT